MEIMRVIGVLAMVAVLFPQAATADVKRHTSIPESLWGSWAPSAESCNNDKLIIALAAKRYVSSEANCTVDWVSETPGAQGAIYSAHLQCAQRARKTISDIVLRPTDSNQLSMGADFSSLKTFQRCPARGPDTIR